MLWVLAILLVPAIASPPPVPSKCPNVKPIENFEFSRFFSGKWYEMSRYDNFDLEIDADCTYANYVYDNGVSNFTLYDVIDGKVKSFGGDVKLSSDAGTTGQVLYSFSRFATGKYPLFVLDTDYDNYGILYNCFYDDDRKNNRELAWIMSRTIVMPTAAQVEMNKFLDQTHIIDLKNVVWEHFNAKTCLVDP